MPIGQEHELLRNKISSMVNRKQGHVLGLSSTCTAADDMDASMFDTLPVLYFTNSDGSLYSPQQANGAFVYLPGFDGPVL